MPNRRVHKRQLDFAWCGALGYYGKIWEIVANIFILCEGLIACEHDLLNLTEILVTCSVLMMVEYKDV